MRNIRGIALIQVLIITMVLTLLGLFISQSIRGQVNLALTMQTGVELELMIESAEAELVQTLLAYKLYLNEQSDNAIVRQWNFHNSPFQLNNNVSVKLQDLNGLLSLNMMSHTVARQLFKELGHEGHPVRTFLDSLKDWIDKDSFKYLNGAEDHYYRQVQRNGPRNGYLQTLEEVLVIKMGNILSLPTWNKYFTAQTTGGLNPLNTPPLLMNAIVGNQAIVDELLMLRENNELTYQRFHQLTGIDGDEYYNFYTGKKIKVELLAKVANQQLRKQFIIQLDPKELDKTVIITEVRWNKE